MIDFINVEKTYKNSAHALQNVSLSIDKGEIFGIVGRSGAGKSTMLKLMGMLETPSNGSVSILGKDISKINLSEANAIKKQIGTVFQGFNLLMQRSVAKNIAFPLELIKSDKQYIKNRCQELAELVDISEKLRAYPSQLSGGQKQRVAIARALASNPKILLCDEPTSALDNFTTREILRLLRDINIKLGVTIIIITHEMAVVKAICGRMAVLEEGRVVDMGDVLDVLENPQSEATRRLMSTYDLD